MTTAPLAPRRLPLVPEDRARSLPPGTHFTRAATAIALAAIDTRRPVDIARDLYGADEATLRITRAATDPSSTSGWGQQVLQSTVGDFLSGLAPQSAAARLFAEALRVELAGTYTVLLPAVSEFPAPVFVSEGGAIAGRAGHFFECHARPGQENDDARRHDERAGDAQRRGDRAHRLGRGGGKGFGCGRVLDDGGERAAACGNFGRCDGGHRDGWRQRRAMVSDFKLLTAAVTTGGGGSNIWVFTHPIQAVSLQLLAAGANFAVPVIPVPSLAAGTVVMLDVNAIASGYSGVPEITASQEAVVHFEETAPLAISSGVQGSGVLATPTLSAFSQNLLVLKTDSSLRLGGKSAGRCGLSPECDLVTVMARQPRRPTTCRRRPGERARPRAGGVAARRDVRGGRSQRGGRRPQGHAGAASSSARRKPVRQQRAAVALPRRVERGRGRAQAAAGRRLGGQRCAGGIREG